LPGLRWRGFTLQLFLRTILPLTVLILSVVFLSQSLHHQAMVQLVGDRNLRAVRAVADALSMQLDHKVSSLRTAARIIEDGAQLGQPNSALDLVALEFNGGLGLYDSRDHLVESLGGDGSLADLPTSLNHFWSQLKTGSNQTAILAADTRGTGNPLEWVGLKLSDGRILAGGFNPDDAIQQTVSAILTTDQARVLVVNQTGSALYYSGDAAVLGSVMDLPGVKDALNGESGVNTSPGHQGDLVTAFTSVPQAGWAVVLEENWEEIATPFLSTTQSAPLVLVPLLILALVALLFGARQVIRPLQELEIQAASLAQGDFEAIHAPVGGIAVIQHLQTALGGTADDLEAAQHALRSHIGAITDGVEKERRGLARELHDDTLQALIALNQRFQMALAAADTVEERESIEQLKQMSETTIANLRRMVRGLRPIYLEDLGLPAALEVLARESGQVGTTPVNFTVNGEESRLPPEFELTLYRMAQEALSNAQRHAQPKKIDLSLTYGKDSVSLTISDDGIGFTIPQKPDEYARQGHFGLLGLTERAELVGGQLKIQSQPGKGTIIRISVPRNP
jgi:signal transduction histidine kinase